MKKRIRILIILIISVWLLAACGKQNENIEESALEEILEEELFASEETSEAESSFSEGEASLENTRGPLEFYELMSANQSYAAKADGETCDWLEIRNISEEDVLLSDYYISDKNSNRLKYRLPEQTAAPGEIVFLYCDDEEDAEDGFIHTNFSLSNNEALWLSDGDENVIDYVNPEETLIDGSIGRMEGEEGWFYFSVPTPMEENSDGKRSVSEMPKASVETGEYNGTEELKVELTAAGTVYYTLDGQKPTEESLLYTKPITVTETTVLRAISVEEEACPSRVSTYTYLLNENHSLPVISFTADNLQEYNIMYANELEIYKDREVAGTVTLIENGREVFTKNCGIKQKGFTAMQDEMKKNLGVYFRGKYGEGDLKDRDLFGNGVTEYSSFLIRAGQDIHNACIRNELCQELCLQMTDKVACQHSKYCIYYLNGEYKGIYCLKENMNEDFFAEEMGVSAGSVTTIRGEADVNACEDLRGVIDYCIQNDMAIPENYNRFCERFDIDNFIDYVILEEYCGNTDLKENVRFYKSTESDNKWRLAYYDLDLSFYMSYLGFSVIYDGAAKKSIDLTMMANSLKENPEFREKFLTRYAEVIKTVLSNENVVKEIDSLAEVLKPEMDRNQKRYGISVYYWPGAVESLRNMIAEEDYAALTVKKVCGIFSVTEDEYAAYFG